jgi:hypothetical protein
MKKCCGGGGGGKRMLLCLTKVVVVEREKGGPSVNNETIYIDTRFSPWAAPWTSCWLLAEAKQNAHTL